MKHVVAIIQPFKLEEVEGALREVGVSGINITEVMRFGHQKEPIEIYRGTEQAVRFVPKTKVEVAVPDNPVDRDVDAIAGSAHTGEIRDGKIFVASTDRVMRIRTGDTDDAAL
jgi:nitrogen regulatory protein PII